VQRIDITLSAEAWQNMLADMTDMLGAFGAGAQGQPMLGGGGAGPTASPPMGVAGSFPMPGLGAQPPRVPGGGTSSALLGTMPMPAPANADLGNGSVDLVPRTPIYVECQITSAGVTLNHVGIRFKGNSSLAMPWQQGLYKLPFRLKFDEFDATYPETEHQRFHGFADLSLSNGQSDPSLLRDKIGTEVFAHAGLPAPASAYYRVYINHGDGPIYFGLYTGIELPKEKAFLKRCFGNTSGDLYKPDGVGARFQVYDEASLAKENNEAAADFSDVKGLFDALHADRSDAAAWRAELESHLDVDGFLHWLALNTVIQDWDSYGQMPHNYYLYADPNAAGRLAWIPWDHSYAFTAERSLSLSLAEVTESWPLIRYLLDDTTYAATYRDYLRQASTQEYEPSWAETRFQTAHDLIAPYVTGPDGERSPYSFSASPDSFNMALDTLKSHVQQRQADVAAFLGQ
jgi:hypothetical protein